MAAVADRASQPIVLNVDDSDERLRYRSTVLEDSKFAVVEARTGTEALRVARERQPALVLLDVHLPDLDGFEVCRRLKADPLTESIPVLHVSAAYPDDAHEIEGLRGGADSYLREPVSAEVLVEVIRALLRRVSAEAAARQARDEAEQAMRLSERRYRSLFEHAPYGICQTMRDGRFLSVNDALAAMLGYHSRRELLAAGSITPFYVNPADRERLIAQLERRRPIRGAEVAMRRADGQQVTVRISSRPIEDGYEAFVEDVTERQRLEEQLRQSQKLEAIGQLAGGIAHDFNNTLTVILGYADMLARQIGTDKPLGRDLVEIRRSAEHAASLTHQLLAFARQQPLRLAPVDLSAVVVAANAMLRRLVGERVMIRTQLAPSPCTLMADAMQLQQVIVNLVVNARDAMPDGGVVTIETELLSIGDGASPDRTGLAPGRYVQLVVRDTGAGMDEATKRHLFEPFFTTKQVGAGTGLGLSTAYGIVQQLGGSIAVDSAVNQGTRFALHFPWTDQDPQPRSSPAYSVEDSIPTIATTVLVVEDEAAVRALTVAALQRHGYQIIEAAGPMEALQLTDTALATVDLLVADIVMPFMSGRSLARRLRARRPELRVLFMSGYGATTDGEPIGTVGEPPLLRKPFTAPALLSAVHDALNGSGDLRI
jgi:two-component system cell cycle sensor histidine kinase/response regulator CckA